MARPKKNGFDYFPNDVNFYNDIKIRKLLKAKGATALCVYHCLLCSIYQNGYYLEWDEDMPFIISELVGLDEDVVNESLEYCMKLGLFNSEQFSQYHVVTSASIQYRYMEIIKQAKRKNKIEKYNLIEEEIQNKDEDKGVTSEETDNNSEETVVNSEETVDNSVFSTQRKEKEKEYIYSSNEEVYIQENKLSQCDTQKKIRADCSKVISLWHEVCTSYPAIRRITDQRKKKIELRMKELEYNYDTLRLIFEKMQASKFMKEGGWASFDWVFTSEGNMTKVLEGNYDDRKADKRTYQEINKSVNDLWN